MNDTTKLMGLAKDLENTLEVMRRLHGDRWPAQSAGLRPDIERIMRDTGEKNPLAAVLPAAKEMGMNGQSPAMLIAVAVEMAAEEPQR